MILVWRSELFPSETLLSPVSTWLWYRVKAGRNVLPKRKGATSTFSFHTHTHMNTLSVDTISLSDKCQWRGKSWEALSLDRHFIVPLS